MTVNTNKKNPKEFIKRPPRNVIKVTKLKSLHLIKSKTDNTLCINYSTLKQKKASRISWEIIGQH